MTIGPASLAAALILMASTSFAAPAPDAPSRVFEPRDVFSLRSADDPRIRPDGAQIVYVRRAYDIMSDRAARSLWLVDVAGGAQTPLVDGPSAGSPRWSPDGARLAYVAAVDGAPQLFVRWMATGATARVATLPQAPHDIAWSPDGKSLAFLEFAPAEPATLGEAVAKPEGAKWADPIKVIDKVTFRADDEGYLKPGHDHIWIVAADGGAPRQLTFGDFDDGGSLSFTPDGRYILFSSNRDKDWERQPTQSDIYRVSVDDGALTQLTHVPGPAGDPVASPDGRRIAYVGFVDAKKPYQDSRVYLIDADGGAPRSLTDGLDRPVHSVRWAPDGKGLFIEYSDHAATKVARLGLDGAVRDIVAGLAPGGGLDRPYTGGAFSVSKAGVVAFTQGDATHPADLAVTTPTGARRLTDLNADLLHGKALGRLTALPAASSHDGLAIDAWRIDPPNYDPARKYPMILEIHGGPYGAYGPLWSSDDQLYAAAGYVVVYANPRGSTGYGQAFADGIAHNYPGWDFDDLMSVVDAAIARGGVDANNLYVTGGSGGGLMTAWIVGTTDRFRAAAAQKPVINWVSETLTTDGYDFMGPYWLGATPWDDPDIYWKHSPLSRVGHVKTPTLVMVGEEDHRTPPSEAEQFYAGLQLRAVPTALIRIPGASHEAYAERPSQNTAEVSAILAWFDKYKAK
jgi:dipeptidyl aminopeptidase/acylaminoacyl peptidase